ncbi:MAG: Gfo/Idh/MocA family oxidoreductase [Clostridia bacterium]|nr:Gfo/Idh/MocA family oxidoreductase [Clostridia bacterium]
MIIKREKRERVRLGWIGVGRRGFLMLKLAYKMDDVDVVWVCDLVQSKLERAEGFCEDTGKPLPKFTQNYFDVLNDKEVDAVIVMTDWYSHAKISLDSLRAGKYTGVEVGCVHDIDECFKLVDAYEEFGAPLMMLENCCYGRTELAALKMARAGLFGELIHADGSYSHYLNEVELFGNAVKKEWDETHYRQYEYQNRNCENYPTHAFGPIAKTLGINRGNRAMTISSFASKSRGLNSFVSRHLPEDYPLYGKDFKQGDIVTSVITCANGETVRLTLDTTLPRPYYSRSFSIRGTLGGCIEEGNGSTTFFLEGMAEGVMNNKEEFFEKYDHPLHKNGGIEDNGGHAEGIDWHVLRAFFEAVKAGTDTPIDAYDTATWLAIGPLSTESIARGGAPVAFPDFTKGAWFHREPPVKSIYCVDEVFSD